MLVDYQLPRRRSLLALSRPSPQPRRRQLLSPPPRLACAIAHLSRHLLSHTGHDDDRQRLSVSSANLGEDDERIADAAPRPLHHLPRQRRRQTSPRPLPSPPPRPLLHSLLLPHLLRASAPLSTHAHRLSPASTHMAPIHHLSWPLTVACVSDNPLSPSLPSSRPPSPPSWPYPTSPPRHIADEATQPITQPSRLRPLHGHDALSSSPPRRPLLLSTASVHAATLPTHSRLSFTSSVRDNHGKYLDGCQYDWWAGYGRCFG
jgi:hypothetical protein